MCKDERTNDIAICFLRVLMSFEIVVCHFGGEPAEISVGLAPFGILHAWAVPTFLVISFMLTSKHFYARDKQWFGNRLKRLLVPQIVWAVLYYLAFKVHDYFLASKWIGGPISILIQIATGAHVDLCPQMWFQTVLIVLTILVFFAFYLWDGGAKYILLTLTVVLLTTYYSGYHNMIFAEMPTEVQYSYGNVSVMLPYAVIGLFLYDKREKWWPLKNYLAVGGIILTVAIYILNSIFGFTENLLVHGGPALICFTITFFICTMCIPFEKMNVKIKNMIVFISKYTMGIYCIHYGVGKMMPSVLHNLNMYPHDFIIAIIDFFVSLLIAILIAKIPLKLCKYLVL